MPNCELKNNLSSVNDVIGGYNEATQEIIVIHRFSNNIWVFDSDTLQYESITASNTLNDINPSIQKEFASVSTPPLYATVNESLYIWPSNVDIANIAGFNMTGRTFFNPNWYDAGAGHRGSIIQPDGTCMVTDGRCLIIVYRDNLRTATLNYLNLCDPPVFWQSSTTGLTVTPILRRARFSCIIRDKKLYFIGGATIIPTDGAPYPNIQEEIRFIDISSIYSCIDFTGNCPATGLRFELKTLENEWNLNIRRRSAETINFEDSILIIGGFNGAGRGGFTTTSEIMDFREGETLNAPTELNLEHASSLLVLANRDNAPALFIFGGINQQNGGGAEQCVVGMIYIDIIYIIRNILFQYKNTM